MTGFSLPQGLWLGRVWRAGVGPCVVTLRGTRVFDITSRVAPTMRDLLELPDIAGFVASLPGEDVGQLDALLAASIEPVGDATRLLAPCDLQAIKACGVTFARSMVERVIEERAALRHEGGLQVFTQRLDELRRARVQPGPHHGQRGERSDEHPQVDVGLRLRRGGGAGRRRFGFGGRVLDRGEPKYLNSPETPLFDKGR